jgi:hypothetical protein
MEYPSGLHHAHPSSMQLTWHVIMDKEEGRSATHFVADKGSPGADETRVVG